MVRPSTRERKIEFIKSFGYRALETAISEAVYRFGAENFLTDDQLDEITTEQVRQARFSAKLNRENRKRLAALASHQTKEQA